MLNNFEKLFWLGIAIGFITTQAIQLKEKLKACDKKKTDASGRADGFVEVPMTA